MSIRLDTLRWLTVRAIRGRTWALDKVMDSPSTPADIRTETDREPFISVYVDDADEEIGEFPGMMVSERSDIRLVLECGVSSAKRFRDTPDGAQEVDLDIPDKRNTYVVTELNATDEGLEAQIGFLTYQAIQALLSTAETNPWAELWRMFTEGKVLKVETRRGGPGDQDKGAKPRYASRITILHLAPVLPEPPRGADLDEYPFWSAFIAACQGDEEYAELGEILKMHFERPTGTLEAWRIAQKLLGAPKRTIRALGIAPQHPTDETAHSVERINNEWTDPPALDSEP